MEKLLSLFKQEDVILLKFILEVSMRRIYFSSVLVLCLLFMLNGCTKKEVSNTNTMPESNVTKPIEPAPPPKPTIEEEAFQYGKSIWDRVLTNCGDSYYKYYPGNGFVELKEFKKVVFVLHSKPITEADKLNGIEWQGNVEFTYKLYRSKLPRGSWQPWENYQKPIIDDGIDFLIIKKTEKGWEHSFTLMAADPFGRNEVNWDKTDCKNIQGSSEEIAFRKQLPAPLKSFKITSKRYSEKDDLSAAITGEFGSDYTIADWNDILQYANSIDTFISGLNIQLEEQNSLFITKNGKRFWDSRRHFYVSRFDHRKPSNYLSHEDIDNHHLDLGSWYGVNFQILCIKTPK